MVQESSMKINLLIPPLKEKKMSRFCYKFLLKILGVTVIAQFCHFRESDLQYIPILSFANTKGKVGDLKKSCKQVIAHIYHRYLEKRKAAAEGENYHSLLEWLTFGM